MFHNKIMKNFRSFEQVKLVENLHQNYLAYRFWQKLLPFYYGKMTFFEFFKTTDQNKTFCAYPASILYKSTAVRYRPVSYPDRPITTRYRFKKNAYWASSLRQKVMH